MKNHKKQKKPDGSFSDINQQFIEWKRQRYGITSPRNIGIKIRKALDVLAVNKIGFLSLILFYLLAQIIGNAAVLVVLNSIKSESLLIGNRSVMITLTANLPCRIFRSLLDFCVYYVTMCAIKKRDYHLDLMDCKYAFTSFSFSHFFKIFLIDEINTFAVSAAQLLLTEDTTLCIIYFIIGFILNYLFSMSSLLIIEDSSLSTVKALIWSASTSLNSQYKKNIFLCTLILFLASPMIITVPFLIIFHVLSFYEAFGYSSPTEIHFTTTD